MLIIFDREMMSEKYQGKLMAHYEAPQHSIVAQVFRGLAGKKVVTPSKDFVRYVISSSVILYLIDCF